MGFPFSFLLLWYSIKYFYWRILQQQAYLPQAILAFTPPPPHTHTHSGRLRQPMIFYGNFVSLFDYLMISQSNSRSRLVITARYNIFSRYQKLKWSKCRKAIKFHNTCAFPNLNVYHVIYRASQKIRNPDENCAKNFF